jgi:hypothetical protein
MADETPTSNHVDKIEGLATYTFVATAAITMPIKFYRGSSQIAPDKNLENGFILRSFHGALYNSKDISIGKRIFLSKEDVWYIVVGLSVTEGRNSCTIYLLKQEYFISQCPAEGFELTEDSFSSENLKVLSFIDEITTSTKDVFDGGQVCTNLKEAYCLGGNLNDNYSDFI